MIITPFTLFAFTALTTTVAQLNSNESSTCILGTQTGCSTSVCSGLTTQIKSELNTMGYSFVAMDSTWVKCSSPCVNCLQSVAATALESAAKSKGDYITCTR
jgi:hypothetical protein